MGVPSANRTLMVNLRSFEAADFGQPGFPGRPHSSPQHLPALPTATRCRSRLAGPWFPSTVRGGLQHKCGVIPQTLALPKSGGPRVTIAVLLAFGSWSEHRRGHAGRPGTQADRPRLADARRRDGRREGHPRRPAGPGAAVQRPARMLRRSRPAPEGRAHVALRGDGQRRRSARSSSAPARCAPSSSRCGSPRSCASARRRGAPR